MEAADHIKELIDRLQGKDKTLFGNAEELLRELENLGASKRIYRLSLPFGSKRVHVEDDPAEDPRTIELGVKQHL